jgi:enoyl-CoA hydratase/carnithine racemase
MDAEEALQMGLINRICSPEDLEAQVRGYAELIAGNAPLTVKAAKTAINEALKDPERRDIEKISEMIDACFDSEDYKEGRRAFAEKREPKFSGR